MSHKIADNEIHLWFVRPSDIHDKDLLNTYLNALSHTEKTKQQQFHFAKQRQQYLISRALLRIILSSYVKEIEPQEWNFSYNLHGKPSIANSISSEIYFNLSHTGDQIVLAFTKNPVLGIDTENLTRSVKILALSKRYFSEEEYQFILSKKNEEQPYYFFALWTLKEATVKALGLGMAQLLNKIAFEINKDEILVKFHAKLVEDAHNWNFWLGTPNSTHLFALAIKNVQRLKYKIISQEIIPDETLTSCQLDPHFLQG